MVKQLHFKLMLLLCALVVGSGSLWAAENVSTVSTKFSEAGTVTEKFTQTGDYTSAVWGLAVTWKNANGYWGALNSDKGSQVGSGSNPATSIVLTGSSIPGTITSVKVNSSVASGGTTTVGVTVGGTAFKCDNNTTANLQTSAADYVFTGSGSGNVVLSWSQPSTSKAIYIKSITVTYTTSNTPAVATIGALSPTALEIGDIDDFSLNITPATGLTDEDYVVTWESSDSNILELDDETYEAKAAGEVTVTVTVTPDDDTSYSEVSKQFTVTVTDPNAPGTQNNPYTVAQAIANTPSTGDVYIKGIVSSFVNTSIMGDGSNFRYYISDDGTNSNHLLVYKGKKNATDAFSAVDDLLIGDEVVICGTLTTYSNAPEVNTGNYIVSLIRKPSPELAFNPATATCDLLAEFTEPTLSYAAGFDGTVTFTSSDEDVATVNASGEVTLVGVGETTITASSAATAAFSYGTASYTLTVTKRDDVAPVAQDNYYVKVTSEDDLEGGQYLIVCEERSVAFDGSSETLDAANNFIDVVIDNNKIAATAATQAAMFTLYYDPVEEDWTLYSSAAGKYIGRTNNINGLDSSEEPEYNTISFTDDGDVNIIGVGGAYLRYNATSGQTRFRYFRSSTYTSQEAIQLYKYVPCDSKTVTLSGYGYKTLVSSNNFTVSGATAYIVTATSQTNVTTAEVNVVPANEPVFLKGSPNAEVTLTFTDADADDVSGNLLAVSTADQGNGCFVLSYLEGEGVGFFLWAGGSLGGGRVILPASVVPNGARQFLAFNEATGIDDIANKKSSNGEWYDLQGRRVVKAQKGVYIVNGKKVVKR